MDRADGFNSPQRRPGGGKALAHAEEDSANQQRGDRQQRNGLQQHRSQRKDPAQQAADDPEADDFFRSPDIGVAPGVRPAEQGGDVLQTDHHAGNKGAIAELIVNVAG